MWTSSTRQFPKKRRVSVNYIRHRRTYPPARAPLIISSCATVRPVSLLFCSSPSLLPELKDSENEIVLGNQLKSIYRFGEMAHCSTKWNEFKFCMSIKGLHPEQRRDTWIRHRAEWWARRRLGSSSENVWEKRTYVSLSLNSYCIENASPTRPNDQRTIKELPATLAPARGHRGYRRLSLIVD